MTKKITKQVHYDLSRRRNVVVSGLLEGADASSDKTAFVELCSTQLKLAPRITFTKRLGVNTTSRGPRKLLIGLSCEEEAINLVRASKNLRKSADRKISSTVFINKHLSPEEAKKEFDKRQSKRQLGSQTINSRLNPGAASFSSSSPINVKARSATNVSTVSTAPNHGVSLCTNSVGPFTNPDHTAASSSPSTSDQPMPGNYQP